MKAVDIISLARIDFLDDTKTDYLWSAATLLTYLNDAEKEATVRNELIKDDTTATDNLSRPVCSIPVVIDTKSYALHPKIIRVETALLASVNYPPLVEKTEDWLDEQYSEWRTASGTPVYFVQRKGEIILIPNPIIVDTLNLKVVRLPLIDMVETPISITGSANMNFTAATKQIDMATADFIGSGIRIGAEIVVTSSASNNGTLTVRTVEKTALTTHQALTDETNTNANIVTDSIPEIPEEYHMGLIDWICHMAYSKQDNETEDRVKAEAHRKKFDLKFGVMPSVKTMDARRKPRNISFRPKVFGG